MCTAVSMNNGNLYFGRTLDLECSYGETVTFTPRNCPLEFREVGLMNQHYAMLGIAHVVNDVALYYDGMNEKGLAMAGLNFPGNARYRKSISVKENIAHFELISWVLAQCGSVQEAKDLLNRINITNRAYNDELPVSHLHWILADRKETVTVEAVEEGLKLYPNPVGVLTNNPPFPQQLFQLHNYMNLSPDQATNCFSRELDLQPYSQGMGALGLPGDWSSQSRFVRAAFAKLNAVCEENEEACVSQFFHIMDTVAQPRGCCKVGQREYEITLYTSCCNADQGIYYYTTYQNRRITRVDMHREDMDGNCLVSYPLITDASIFVQN